MDLSNTPKFPQNPVKRLRVNHPADSSLSFQADIKSVRHRDVKPHYDGVQNRLTDLAQRPGGKKAPEYAQAIAASTKLLAHEILSGGFWDLKMGGQDFPNTQENRDKLFSLIPGIEDEIKALAEDDKNFFEAPGNGAPASGSTGSQQT